MSVPLLVLAMAIPLGWSAHTVFLRMPRVLGVSLVEAYELIDVSVGLIAAFAISAVIVSVVMLAFALVSLNTRQRWRWDQPYSVWRIVRLTLLVFGCTAAAFLLPANAMSIALYNVTPFETLDGLGVAIPWGPLGIIAVLASLAMWCADFYNDPPRRFRAFD